MNPGGWPPARHFVESQVSMECAKFRTLGVLPCAGFRTLPHCGMADMHKMHGQQTEK